jgi:hypothetical protein
MYRGCVFERFTERARQVVVLAQDEARRLGHNYIGTEHILLGLLREEEGLAARVLEVLHVTLEEVRAQVARIVGQGDEAASGQIPFTPRAKRVLELSLREALALGHNYIGTEHILLGLVRENSGVAAQILLDFGADAEMVRNEIVEMLSGPQAGIARRGLSRREQGAGNPELGAELERIRQEKEDAIAADDLERAAELRVRERKLRQQLLGVSAPREIAFPGRSSVHVAAQRQIARPGRLDSASLAVGGALLAGGAGLGILVGWLLWA